MKIPSIILVGGNVANPYYHRDPYHLERMFPTASVDMIAGDLRTKQLPNLPFTDTADPVIFEHNDKILLLCATKQKKCYQLDVKGHTWKEHSILNRMRIWTSAIATNTATFIFGGNFSPHSFEYLPKGSTTWMIGKSQIPGGFSRGGCAIFDERNNEILLIGSGRKILSFSIENHTFDVLPQELNVGRWGHQAILIPGTNKVLITGGEDDLDECKDLDSTEILDLKDKSIEMASPMNCKRACHGLGLINVNDRQRIAAFGGNNYVDGCLNSVEFYDPITDKWEISYHIKLEEARADFGYITTKWTNI